MLGAPRGASGACAWGAPTSFPPGCTAEAPCSGMLSFPGDGQVLSLPRMLLCYPTVPQLHPVTPVIINNSDFKRGLQGPGDLERLHPAMLCPSRQEMPLLRTAAEFSLTVGRAGCAGSWPEPATSARLRPPPSPLSLGAQEVGKGPSGANQLQPTQGLHNCKGGGGGPGQPVTVTRQRPGELPGAHPPPTGLQARLGWDLLLGGVDRGPHSFVSGPQAGRAGGGSEVTGRTQLFQAGSVCKSGFRNEDLLTRLF